MYLVIVTEDLGDGDVALRYFPSVAQAQEFIDKFPEACWHESNPHCIKVDENFKFNKMEDFI